MPKQKWVIASTSVHKVTAVKAYIDKAYGRKARNRDDIEVLGCKTASGVNEQPIGFEETTRGAISRLRDAKCQHPDADLWVSIESGLMRYSVDEQKFAIDLAVVIIEMKDGRRAVATSPGISFPLGAVQIAEIRGFNRYTVGRVIAEIAEPADGSDPHAIITLGRLNRTRILVHALEAAFAQVYTVILNFT